MKIKIENFGPIRSFETDLDMNFLLILGENNIGKSYAISLVYVILKTFTGAEYVDRPMYGYLLEDILKRLPAGAREDFQKAFKAYKGKVGVDARELYRAALIENFRLFFLDQFSKSISGTYGEISNLENRRSQAPATISISTDRLEIFIEISGGKISVRDVAFSGDVYVRPSKQRRTPKISNSDRIIYGPVEDVQEAINNIVMDAMGQIVSFANDEGSNISDVHYLPASRSGLYQALSAFGQIIAELSKQRSFLSQRIELPAISEPLVDYFIKLTEIRPSRKTEAGKYHEIADELEQKVLGGAVEFDVKSKRLFYKPYGLDLKLDLSSTSSMVSEVAPIATYLRHVLPHAAAKRYGFVRRYRAARPEFIRRKQILFIEEPEAHLHPRTQVALMQCFARLASECDVKIVMTSHSNFVFNKLSNLVIAKILAVEGARAYIFRKTDDGTVGQGLEVDSYGISDENFSEVAEDIFNEKLELIDLISAGSEGDNAL